jgi:hypothetical protein
MGRDAELSQAMRNVHALVLAFMRDDDDAVVSLIPAMAEDHRGHWLSALGIIAALAGAVGERDGISGEQVMQWSALLEAADEARILGEENDEDD